MKAHLILEDGHHGRDLYVPVEETEPGIYVQSTSDTGLWVKVAGDAVSPYGELLRMGYTPFAMYKNESGWHAKPAINGGSYKADQGWTKHWKK